MTLRRARSRIKDWHLCALCFVAFPVILVALMLAGLSEFGQGLLAFGFMFLVAGLINKQESDHRSSDSATLDDDASDLER